VKKFLFHLLTIVCLLALTPLTAQATGDITIFVNPGNAVSGATVSFMVSGQSKSAQSDNMGIARFSGIPAGTYNFKVAKSGYSDGSAAFTIVEGSNTGSIYLGVQTGNATITVNDKATGKPVSSVQVSVMANGQQAYLNTDASGVAAFTNIKTGTYIFEALVSGYKTATTTVTITNGGTAQGKITIEALTSVPGSGYGDVTVFANPGSPISNAVITFTVNGQTKTAQSDSKGMAKFTQIPAGSYTFKSTKFGYYDGSLTQSIYSGVTTSVSLPMATKYGNATITVVDAAKKAISGAEVGTYVSGQLTLVNTNSSGAAAYTKIQIGTYTFSVRKSGYNDNSAVVSVTLNNTTKQTIALAQPLQVTLHFTNLPNGLTLDQGILVTSSGGYAAIVSSITKDQNVTIREGGTFDFKARWIDASKKYRYTKTSAVNIPKSGKYDIKAYGDPGSPF